MENINEKNSKTQINNILDEWIKNLFLENDISVYFNKKIINIDDIIIILMKLISFIFEYTEELTSVIDLAFIYK